MALFLLRILVLIPRTVVAGVDHQRIITQALLVQHIQQAASLKIELLNHIPVQSSFRFSAKLFRGANDRVHHRMRHVEDKGLFLVALFLQKIDGLICVKAGEATHIAGVSRPLIILMKGNTAAVIGPKGPKVVIEALGIRHAIDNRLAIGNIPFPNTDSLVTGSAHQFRPGDLGCGHAPTFAANGLATGKER